MIALAAIATGYALLIWQFGWAGVAVAVLHMVVMVGATGRG